MRVSIYGRYVPARSIWVTTAVEGETVRLAGEDTGEMLAPDVVSTLVEPFQRGTERVRADDAGVGLGLAIVERISRAHDGSLVLATRPTGGLRVEVRLPAASAASRA
jgi:two-component system sensor histidine kinase VanS